MKKTTNGWYVLYVRSKHEKRVSQLLQEKGVETFLPMKIVTRQWSDRKKKISVPLFSSYVFVNIKSNMDFYKSLEVESGCSFIRFGATYALVKEKEIEQIRWMIGEKELSDIEVGIKLPKVGEMRRITSGVLEGKECEILKVNNTNKMVVRIKSLNQNITATVPSLLLSRQATIC